MILGLVLAAIELATPGGFFIIFFGIAALIVGVLDLAGIAQRDWVQWLLFPVIALVALRLFRQPLVGRLAASDRADDVDALVGAIARATSDMAPRQHGSAELRGATWNALNVDSQPIAAGQRCRVTAVDGLRLDITAE